MVNFLNNIFSYGIFFILIAFLLGSVPFGLIYSMIRGVDIRSKYSGNIGATNVARVFGFWQGFLVILLLDMGKGMLSLFLFKLVASKFSSNIFFEPIEILIGLSAILGHIFSPFLNFKGGKGVATAVGVFFVLNPYIISICIGIFLGVFFTFGHKIVGRGSIVCGIFFPIISLFFPGTSLFFKIISFVIGVIILITHRKNIKAWISGEDLLAKTIT